MENADKFKLVFNANQSMCMKVALSFPRSQWPLTEFPFMTLLLQLFVVFVVTQGLHHLFFKHLRIPPLLSQLTAGIILSETVYTAKVKGLSKLHELVFPPASDEVLKCIAMLGYALTMFTIAVKMDFTIVTRMGRKPVIIGLLVLVTGITNTLVAYTYMKSNPNIRDHVNLVTDLSSTATLTALTSFPVIGILLSDMKLLNSELGRLAASAGIISDAASISVNVVSKSYSTAVMGGFNKKKVLREVGKTAGLVFFLLLTVICLRALIKWMIKRTPKGKRVKDRYLILIFLLMLVAGLLTNSFGEFVLLGFFFIGAAIPEGPPLGSAIVEKFDFLVSDVLQPFFLTTIAMKTNVFSIQFRGHSALGHHLVLLSAYATKTIVCLTCGFFFKMTIFDSLALAAIMSSKGIFDIGNFVMFRSMGAMMDSTFSYLILVTTIAALVLPMAIKHLYNPLRKYAGFQKRSIMHSKQNSPLRILSCIWRPDNVSSITNLLTLSGPSIRNPMIVDVLHLLKLVGRSQPIFISHKLQQRTTSSEYEDIIWAFSSLSQSYVCTALSMHFFTVVSPPVAMHEDVCTLALDNLDALIILPFHRKMNIDGHVEIDDQSQRALNKSVLECAPCSVGILIDRGYSRMMQNMGASATRSHSSIRRRAGLASISVQQPPQDSNVVNVAVIFIGGKDDQEAIAYAKRIARGSTVNVQVIRLVPLGGASNNVTLLDSVVLSEIRDNCPQDIHMSYFEKTVKDGSESAMFLRSIIANFALIIVGRRSGLENCPQTLGLQEWSEVPELGALGDLLAQPDLNCGTSVLVIQQQRQWTNKND